MKRYLCAELFYKKLKQVSLLGLDADTPTGHPSRLSVKKRNATRYLASPLYTITSCRKCFTPGSAILQEVQDMKDQIILVLSAVSDYVSSKIPILEFVPILCGSIAEGTKGYNPDEFDFICHLYKLRKTNSKFGFEVDISKFHQDLSAINRRLQEFLSDRGMVNVAKLASLFYSLFHKAIIFLKRPGHTFHNLKLCDFIVGDKIKTIRIN